MSTLVYLYGPPAAGKLTIAERLAELTGSRLFHNHLTVNAITPVFEFESPAFTEVLHRLRLDVFATAARAGVDLIFTNNSAWSGQDARTRFVTFADSAARIVAQNGGTTRFVQIMAPSAVLESRLADDSRRVHGKLVDVRRLRALLATHDAAPLHPDDMIVSSGDLTPEEAAGRIAAELVRRRS
ncbi:MAG: shikimate kinase [Acidimicrobiia bacterium]